MIYENLITAWIGVLREILGDDYKVIRAEGAVGKGAVRPAGKFVTIKIIAGPDDYTIDEVQRFNAEDKMELVSAKMFTVSIQAFRDGALDAILRIKAQLENPDYVDYLQNAAHISVTNRGGVTDLSQQFETGFEERFQSDISFAVGFTAQTDIGIIESASVERSA